MFQSRGRDLLIGKSDALSRMWGLLVSVPWSGFINRKEPTRTQGNPQFRFQSRGRDLLIGKKLWQRSSKGWKDCFSPVVGIY